MNINQVGGQIVMEIVLVVGVLENSLNIFGCGRDEM